MGESGCFDRRLFVSRAKFGWVWQVATAAEIFYDSICRNQRMLENKSRKQNNETKKSFARIKIVFAKTEQRITLLLVFHCRASAWQLCKRAPNLNGGEAASEWAAVRKQLIRKSKVKVGRGLRDCRCVSGLCQAKKALAGLTSGSSHASSSPAGVFEAHLSGPIWTISNAPPPQLQTKCNTNVRNNPVNRQNKFKTMV